MEEKAVDVSNMDNSVERWKRAVEYYRSSGASIRRDRTEENIRCVAIMDTSYSMDGTRLICVKLGLCSLLANFESDDEVSLISFATKVQSVTDGFKPVSELVEVAPKLLHDMDTNGCTACYDAIVDGITKMRDRVSMFGSFSSSHKRFKNVAIVLTDGDDNESIHTPRSVEKFLISPGMKTFMFLFVAVEMSRRSELKFRRWMEMSHCKQVSVSVRTGSALVGVFKEMLLCRILQSEGTSTRFIQNGSCVEAKCENLQDVEIDELRCHLLRTMPNAEKINLDAFEGNELDEFSYHSAGVSVVDSCSSGGGDNSEFEFEDECWNDSNNSVGDSDSDSDSESLNSEFELENDLNDGNMPSQCLIAPSSMPFISII